MTPEHYDAIVIGGGQAGLAVGHHLAQQGRLTDYARHFALPVELDSRVTALQSEDGGYRVELANRTLHAQQVVIATGPFQVPRVPAFASQLAGEVVQLHSAEYRTPIDLPAGRVLVVGGGNTGFQIAEELAGSRDVHPAIGSRQTPLPQRILGRDLFGFLTATGLMNVTASSRIGQRLKDREALIGSSPRAARRSGITIHRRATHATGSTVAFADGSRLDVDAVLWATGFDRDHAWIHAPIFDHHGVLIHERGVTPSPGLYFLGMPWQHTRGSALLGWVKHDAEHVAERICARTRSQRVLA
jgi:putative flavoprotein involved in K+ transport